MNNFGETSRLEKLMKKRLFFQTVISVAGASLLPPVVVAQNRPQVEVWKDPFDAVLIHRNGTTRIHQSYHRA